MSRAPKKITNFCKDYKEAKWGSIRQDFEPCFIRNGAIYAMTRDCIVKSKSRWGKKSFPLIMSDKKSINIDTKFDLLMAKMMIENGYCKNFPKINLRARFPLENKWHIFTFRFGF